MGTTFWGGNDGSSWVSNENPKTLKRMHFEVFEQICSAQLKIKIHIVCIVSKVDNFMIFGRIFSVFVLFGSHGRPSTVEVLRRL